VVAELGDPDAARTVVFVAHHDAAHSGLVFHPALPRVGMRLVPRLHERANQSIPIIFGVFLGPVLLGLWGVLGRTWLRSAGLVFAGGALVAIARELAEDHPEGVRAILLSTGSEESFMEGMHGFARRHFGSLDRETTEFVCLECVGSPELCVVEAEGMLRMRHYTESSRDALARAGEEAGVELTRGLRTVAATDALIALRAGYRTCLIGGVDETKFPANYHWPTDVPDNLDWSSIEGAVEVCLRYARG
jgi:hypothetical protein